VISRIDFRGNCKLLVSPDKFLESLVTCERILAGRCLENGHMRHNIFLSFLTVH
jgi:hypothetical protein